MGIGLSGTMLGTEADPLSGCLQDLELGVQQGWNRHGEGLGGHSSRWPQRISKDGEESLMILDPWVVSGSPFVPG